MNITMANEPRSKNGNVQRVYAVIAAGVQDVDSIARKLELSPLQVINATKRLIDAGKIVRTSTNRFTARCVLADVWR